MAPAGGYVPEPSPPMEPAGYIPGPVYPPDMPGLPPPAPGYAPAPQPCLPCWNFVSAPALLPGFGQPYAPNYSYLQGEGILAPPDYAPVAFDQSEPVMNFASAEPFAPIDLLGAVAGIGIGAAVVGGVGTYNWGPPPDYVSRVTNISQTTINQTINDNSKNITKIKNVTPPDKVRDKNKGIKDIAPNTKDGKLPPVKTIKDTKGAPNNLGKPDGIKKPTDIKPIPPNSLKKFPNGKLPPDKAPGLKGPKDTKSQQTLTPQQQQQVKDLGTQKPPGVKPGTPPAGPAGTKPGPSRQVCLVLPPRELNRELRPVLRARWVNPP